MTFELLPVLHLMEQVYALPLSPARFGPYLQLLQTEVDSELALPIAGFNPMAKAHINAKMNELKAMNAEALVSEVLEELNIGTATLPDERIIKVALNLSDDLGGGWTNRYSNDYSSRFSIDALLKRSFCSPIVWASETLTPQLIRQRSREACYRCLYRLLHPKALTLQDHVAQEARVASAVGSILPALNAETTEHCADFFLSNRASENYPLIFSYLYGDKAAIAFGYEPLGFGDFAGLAYAAAVGTGATAMV
ncbi:MAG: hypothetical protein V4543_18085 [Bacteroidota bacterium]